MARWQKSGSLIPLTDEQKAQRKAAYQHRLDMVNAELRELEEIDTVDKETYHYYLFRSHEADIRDG